MKNLLKIIGLTLGLSLSCVGWNMPAFAASSGIIVSNISSSTSTFSASTVITVTGQNLPILSNSSGTPVNIEGVGGVDFTNFAFQDSTSAPVWTIGALPTDVGISIISSTSTELQFSTAYPTGDASGNYFLYLWLDGQSFGRIPTGTNGLVGGFNLTSNTFYPPITETSTLQVSNITSSSVTLKWSAINGANTYQIYENGGSSPIQTGIAGTSTTISGLTKGQTYTFQVAGVNTLGAGSMSPSLSVTPVALVAPQVAISPETSGTLGLTWAPVPGAVSYVVTVNGVKYLSDLIQNYIMLENLPLNSAATITVYAMDVNGNPGTPSTPQTATPELAGPQLSYSRLTTKSITLNWSPVTGATSYHVYEGDPTLVATTSGTSTTVTGLTAGQPYSFTVQAVTSNGNSLSSAPVSITAPIVDWGFSGTDVLANALLIVASLGSLLLLALAIEFVPRLWGLLPLTESAQDMESDEYKQEWDGAPSSSRTDISPVKFDDEGW